MAVFPLRPVPNQVVTILGTRRCNVFYPGEPLVFTFSKTGPTGYTLRDFYGNVISSGSCSGTSLTIAAPALMGFYRLYLTGPNSDSVFGTSYGATNIAVVKSDSRFPTPPAGNAFPANYTDPTAEYGDRTAAGIFGWPNRRSLSDTTHPLTGALKVSDINTALAGDNTWGYLNAAYQDSARPREPLVACPAGTVDRTTINTSTGGNPWVNVYCATESVDGSTFQVRSDAGTTSGIKITVTQLDGTTALETYDNLTTPAGAIAAINTTSSRIKVFDKRAGDTSLGGATLAPTTIGRAFYSGTVTAVANLYPAVKWFEGPSNEPFELTSDQAGLYTAGPELAHQMRLFAAAVHEGNAGAKAVGPCAQTINGQFFGEWRGFFDAGGGAYCDGISFHAYNSTMGDLSLARRSFDTWTAQLTSHGLTGKPLWQTEDGTVEVIDNGVFHPRRARWQAFNWLIMEQYGIPRERNLIFNDAPHGFTDGSGNYAFPCFFTNAGGANSVNPQPVLLRTMNLETWGKTFTSRYNFGQPGDRMYLGNLYSGSDGTKVAVFQASSPLRVGQVILTIAGTSAPLTVVDCFGNTSTVPVVSGRATVPVQDLPVYVRLPAGVTATLYSFSDWPPLGAATLGNHLGTIYPGTIVGSGQAQDSQLADGTWQNGRYGLPGDPSEYRDTSHTSPWLITRTFFNKRRLDRVTIWAGNVYSLASTLLDFDVQTTVDGSTWVTQQTVTNTTATSFFHGCGYDNTQGSPPGQGETGTQRDTFWDEQWIFDVKFPPVSVLGVRLNIRAVSYGGEPDLACVLAGGSGNSNQEPVIQEIGIYCDDTATPRYATKT